MPDQKAESDAYVQWPRFDNGAIMWREGTPYLHLVGCPLCGAAVIDTGAHVRWHDSVGGTLSGGTHADT